RSLPAGEAKIERAAKTPYSNATTPLATTNQKTEGIENTPQNLAEKQPESRAKTPTTIAFEKFARNMPEMT
ncbi:MAG: hypothetical protein IIB67_06220, partial [Proteobacteria bacterium]|nr:hypothetical protein [Pseudomonadota bacterium]